MGWGLMGQAALNEHALVVRDKEAARCLITEQGTAKKARHGKKQGTEKVRYWKTQSMDLKKAQTCMHGRENARNEKRNDAFFK